jgi:Phosphoesterase family.
MFGSRIKRVAVVATAFTLLGGTALFAGAGQVAAAKPVGHAGHNGPQHIFFIEMENHGFSEIIGNHADAPYINWLAKHNGLATNYYGVTHPSLPNYLATISGSFQGIWDDCAAGASITCPPEEFVPGTGDGTDGNYLKASQIASASAQPHLFNGRTIVDQLESKGLTWKAYMQSIPAVGSTVEYAPTIGGTIYKLYAQKHDPFMYFARINHPGSPRLKKIVPYRGLADDLASGNVPNFVWVSPNQCRDMHGTDYPSAVALGIPKCGYPVSGLDHGAIQLGDTFVKNAVTQIMRSTTWKTTDSSIVITWDEDDYTSFFGCCYSPRGRMGVVLGGSKVPTIVINSRDGGRRRTDVRSNHYSLLATIERLWNLGCLANSCKIQNSGLVTSLFHP